jgi:hypothetical protein
VSTDYLFVLTDCELSICVGKSSSLKSWVTFKQKPRAISPSKSVFMYITFSHIPNHIRSMLKGKEKVTYLEDIPEAYVSVLSALFSSYVSEK